MMRADALPFLRWALPRALCGLTIFQAVALLLHALAP